MKYVRTEDGVYEVKDDFIVLKSQELYLPHFQDHIIKEANTIEELGDAYVIVPKDGKHKPYIENTLSVFDDFEDVLKRNDIYLSIWVGALLKPVAKMNNKGDLELL